MSHSAFSCIGRGVYHRYFTGRPTGAPGAISRAARSAGAAVRAALSELAKASEFVLPRPRDERVYAQERGARPVAGL